MRLFTLIPFLALVVILYIVLAFAGGLVAAEGATMRDILEMTAFTVPGIPSLQGEIWEVSWAGLMILAGLIALAIEMVKATQTQGVSLANHGLSVLVFVLALVLFLLVNAFATTTFFLLTVMTLIDVVVGFTITAVTARRDFGGAPVMVGGDA